RSSIQLFRIELAECVDLHELDAGVAEDLIARYNGKQLVHGRGIAAIAIMARIAAELSVGADQRVIDTPGVDPDAIEREPAIPHPDREAMLDLVPETQGVPIERAHHANGRVRKAV